MEILNTNTRCRGLLEVYGDDDSRPTQHGQMRFDMDKFENKLRDEYGYLMKENRKLKSACNRRDTSPIDQNMSIYISRLYEHTDENTVCSMFKSHNIGIIERVDFVKQTGIPEPGIMSAFIHFAVWFDTTESAQLQHSIRTEGFMNINYDNTFTWFTRENRTSSRTKKDNLHDLGNNISLCDLEHKINMLKLINYELKKQI